MNPKPGWVRYMASTFDMIERIYFLDSIREREIEKAAEKLQKRVRTFVACFGEVCTEQCLYTWCKYVLQEDGSILRKKDEEDVGEKMGVNSLSLMEMEFIHEFMVEYLDHEAARLEEIRRFIDLYQ